jgi:hypothetical protein
MPTKNKLFCLLLFEGTFTAVFKDKKSKRSKKIAEIKVFLDWSDPDPTSPECFISNTVSDMIVVQKTECLSSFFEAGEILNNNFVYYLSPIY